MLRIIISLTFSLAAFSACFAQPPQNDSNQLSLKLGSTATAVVLKADERPALPFPPGITVESQCGPVDDLQDVELYDGTLGVSRAYVDQNEPSTVQFQWLDETTIGNRLPDHSPGSIAGVRWCSGTLFSERHVLTAGHCFDMHDGVKTGWITPFSLGANGRTQFAGPDVLANLQQAKFRYQVHGETGAIRTPAVYPVVRLLEYRRGNDKLDYAIVELGENEAGELPGQKFPPATVLTREAVTGETVAIIQHPQGKPKKIEAGQVLKVEGTRILYDDIDTHGGSSGSGVRDDGGHVIGVHTNGGCYFDANKGVSTRAIANVSEIL